MKKFSTILAALITLTILPVAGFTEETSSSDDPDIVSYTIYDDKQLLDGYTHKYRELPRGIIMEMIKDDTLTSYKTAAAVRIFREQYSAEAVSREKKSDERILWRRLKLTDSPFVQVEIMHTLCKLDRYKYFKSMVPALIQKLDHYNNTVNEIAFIALNDIVKDGSNRSREARIVFNTLRKVLFLSRKRLVNINEPGPKLKQKLQLVRWSIKVLGTEELQRLPKEVLNLL